ncbi:hypothetical protein BU24DRAFT_182213 [Aaosphaeria arxii CBS 175.79]|uniref:DUF6590 domain-containing protein n=1 Tax=Aaosphaeria arxii CBS 175.79 TaxID=1450172 RepID=A0A6A5XRU6_9PLEO|nr:uncharacterized protein BU24DRAFT_182213 [Aaosphaeria arxii CBS 175.79]KAF2015629.1 hypothetical protein BU24DRAFT_182213 [Aaosphaeria arxii CBS 175.79]
MEIRDYFSPNTTSTLDPEFKIQQVGFFTVGRMFATLFTEAYGSTATSYNDSVSFVKFGEQVYTQIRRFIVVRAPRRNGHCYACPVFTYEGRATTKRGVDPYEHAIAYSVGNTALRLPGERVDKTIGVIMKDGEPALTDTSRLRFGIYHPIQLNVKVKDLGMVQPEDMQNLVAWWREEQGPIS